MDIRCRWLHPAGFLYSAWVGLRKALLTAAFQGIEQLLNAEMLQLQVTEILREHTRITFEEEKDARVKLGTQTLQYCNHAY